ncbi:MAG: DotU family type IV/VI secretion system protein [Terriglobales bacterium]
MSTQATPIASYRGSTGPEQRGWNLALAFQEALTAVVRVRFGRQSVANADMFRAHIKESLKAAAQEAMTRGYSPEDVQLALYAIVAFIDESVLNCHQPVFADWPRLPLQEELFGGHVAGESFFDNLQRVLSRTDFVQAADLLEIFYLCLLLGYKGRYAVTGSGELGGILNAVRDKIQRIRGVSGGLSPRWTLPAEAVRTAQSDPWVKRMVWTAVGCLVLALLLWGGFKAGLISGASELHALATQARF